MDADSTHDTTTVNDDVNTVEPEAGSNSVEVLERMSSNGDVMQEIASAGEILTRVELDLACSSEKLVNLDILIMQLATRENEFEAFASDKGHISIEKALEFDLLSGLFDSEVRELDTVMASLHKEIVNVREIVSSLENFGETFAEVEEKIHDTEKLLKQSQDQISDLRIQSAKFQRFLLSSFREEIGNDEKLMDLENYDSLYTNTKIKMQTAEEQRHILRMLEKSLAQELDLEKKLAESKQIEEDLKLKLHSSEQELFSMEEEAAFGWERLFESESAAEILMGIAKDLLGRIQILQFNLKSSIQRESDLESKLGALSKMENVIKDLTGKLSQEESKAAGAANKCSLLEESNMKLNEKLRILESTSEKVVSLERKLRESDIQLDHALASSEASQEKQNMLYSSIRDMENLIEDLKLKVLKSERRAECAEEKCVILSEANAELNEELGFLRTRIGSLEKSLFKMEESKRATAKDIGIRTKMITDLVMQLAIRREQLQKQISSVTMENKILAEKLQKTSTEHSVITSCNNDGNSREFLLAKHHSTVTYEKGNDYSSCGLDEPLIDASEAVRTIDAWQLNFKYVSMAILILLISASAAYLFHWKSCPF